MYAPIARPAPTMASVGRIRRRTALCALPWRCTGRVPIHVSSILSTPRLASNQPSAAIASPVSSIFDGLAGLPAGAGFATTGCATNGLSSALVSNGAATGAVEGGSVRTPLVVCRAGGGTLAFDARTGGGSAALEPGSGGIGVERGGGAVTMRTDGGGSVTGGGVVSGSGAGRGVTSISRGAAAGVPRSTSWEVPVGARIGGSGSTWPRGGMADAIEGTGGGALGSDGRAGGARNMSSP